MLKAVFFDLDGTLLPFDEQDFIKMYFGLLCQKVYPLGYKDSNLLIKVINEGTIAMYKNDGSKTNEEVFWNVFSSYFGEVDKDKKEVFRDFYLNEFKQTKLVCKDNLYAKEIVDFVKENVGKVVLSTNPIFPYEGTSTRLGFINLKIEDFDLVSTYENFSYSKPNPMYFIDILNRLNLKSDEVIMFGNNDVEDYECATKAGIKTYLVGDYIISHKDKNIMYEHIKMDEVIDVVKKELCARAKK